MYTHKVHYYETDKMGITHHSNYVRWMEEARVDFLEKKGYGFDRLESEGIASPVVSLECNYKKPSVFSEEIDIEVFVKELKGLKSRCIPFEGAIPDGKCVCCGKEAIKLVYWGKAY